MAWAFLIACGRLRLPVGLRVSTGMDSLFRSGVGVDVPAGQHELHEESSGERDGEGQHKAAFVQDSAHRRKGPCIELEQQNHASSMNRQAAAGGLAVQPPANDY